jgi:sec-independent protein translocase protein TatC
MLFLAGGLFAYSLLVPSVVRISVELNAQLGSELYWTIDGYYSMLMWMVVGLGAAFQFPMVIQVLVYLGIVSVEALRKWRRVMILICFIAAAVITPTPDPINMSIVALPLWFLYEMAIWVAAVYTLRKRNEPKD